MEYRHSRKPTTLQVNLIAPFSTGVNFSPPELATKEAYDELQEALRNELNRHSSDLWGIKWKKEKEMEKDEANNNTGLQFTPSKTRGNTKDPVFLLESILENFELKCFADKLCWHTKYKFQDGSILEVEKVRIRIYEYGQGNITLNTVLKTKTNLDNLTENIEKLYDHFTTIKTNIEKFTELNADSTKNYLIFNKLKEFVKCLNGKMAEATKKTGALKEFSKTYPLDCESRNDREPGIKWIHKLFYIPIPEKIDNNNQKNTLFRKYATQKEYINVANEAFCRQTRGTAVKNLATNGPCKAIYVTQGISIAIVKQSLFNTKKPINNCDNAKYKAGNIESKRGDAVIVCECNDENKDSMETIDNNIVTQSLSRIIQTTGVLDSATDRLCDYIDTVQNYSSLDTKNKKEIRQSAKNKDLHRIIPITITRIANIHSKIYQYENSLAPIDNLLLKALKKEWAYGTRFETIDWQLKEFKDYQDREEQHRLNLRALSFAIVAAFGALFALISILIEKHIEFSDTNLGSLKWIGVLIVFSFPAAYLIWVLHKIGVFRILRTYFITRNLIAVLITVFAAAVAILLPIYCIFWL